MSDLSGLRKPFDDGQVGKLPKLTCKDCSKASNRVCDRHTKSECPRCGNWISTAHIDLDYVGHAQVTDRLLEVDPEWTWEPAAVDDHGAPYVMRDGGRRVLWIRLTVGGVTRLGVGIVGGDKPELEKELIGDALRNAAMRFGVALDLWAKGDLHGTDSESDAPEPSIDWPALGWEDQAGYDKAYALAVAEGKLLPDAAATAAKDWLRDQGWDRPLTSDQLDAWFAKITDLSPGEPLGGTTGDPDGPPEAGDADVGENAEGAML